MHINIHAAHIHGTIAIPPSKSHTLRALIAASLAHGVSSIASPLYSADTASALQVLRTLGVRITEDGTNPVHLTIDPPHNRYFFQTGSMVPTELNLGNSGSLLYFLGTLLAVSTSPFCLTGDCSLQGRPVHPLIQIYRQGGVAYQACQTALDRYCPPLSLQGPLQAQDFHIEGPFSQAVTGLLFALPLLKGTSRIFLHNAGELPYIRMTCEWLKTSGIRFHATCDDTSFAITGMQRYQPFNTRIGGDWSSAAFPLAAALVCNSALTLQNLDRCDTQGDSRILDIVQHMGAAIQYSAAVHTVTILPTADTLKGCAINCADIPDAVPALAALAAFAQGNTVLHHAGGCRFKECDRLHVIAQEVAAFGIDIIEGKDWLCIKGQGGANLHPAQVQSHDDHRIAMMLVVIACGIAARQQSACSSCVQDTECIQVSYPSFIEDFKSIGVDCSLQQ
ncbi:MAG: 3-phosphoshikimate 1-carboxyvinyltransferase [Treponema sp.]